MKKESHLEEELIEEEIIEINPRKNYWKPILFFATVVVIFAGGYCFGSNNCYLGGSGNPFKQLLGSIASASREAFSNIFSNGDLAEEKLVETVNLNKKESGEVSLTTIKSEPPSKSNKGSVNPKAEDSNKIETKTDVSFKVSQTINECSFDSIQSPSHDKIIINEVAWMGKKDSPRSEWLEIKNIYSSMVDISNWQLVDTDGEIRIVFPKGTVIPNQGFYLLERGEDAVPGVKADYLYVGNLDNEGDGLELFGPDCSLVDKIVASPNWPAGTASPTYLTAERGNDLSWHSYDGTVKDGIAGTPKAPNSEVALISQGSSSYGSTANSTNPQPAISETQSMTQAPSSGHPLISEILYDAEGSDTGKEFIELYNPTSEDINLKDWSIKNGSTSLAKIGSLPADLLIIKSSGFFLIGLNSYSGSPAADVVRSASLPNTTATISLYDPNDVLVEAVTYNNSVSAGQSYERESWTSNQFKAEPNPNPKNSGSN